MQYNDLYGDEDGLMYDEMHQYNMEKGGVIYNHSGTDMIHLPDESIDLMITSPPYNVGKEYEFNLTPEKHKSMLFDALTETHRVLVNGGRMCINIMNIGRHPRVQLTTPVMLMADKLGFLLRGEIIWNKGASVGSSTAWGSWKSASNPVLRDVHEYILVFSKGQYKKEHGSGISTIGRDEFMKYTLSIWDFSTVSAKKIGHPAPFPVELPRRLIELYSFADDIVLDPFMGSGTTAEAAIMTGRKYVGYEINPEYVDLANKRLENVKGIR